MQIRSARFVRKLRSFRSLLAIAALFGASTVLLITSTVAAVPGDRTATPAVADAAASGERPPAQPPGTADHDRSDHRSPDHRRTDRPSAGQDRSEKARSHHRRVSHLDLGLRFTVSADGSIVGLRYLRGEQAATLHGTLRDASGKPLARVEFKGAGPGWQYATFDRAVKVRAGQTFLATVRAGFRTGAERSAVMALFDHGRLDTSKLEDAAAVLRLRGDWKIVGSDRTKSGVQPLIRTGKPTPPNPTPAPTPKPTPPAPTPTPEPTPTPKPSPTPTPTPTTPADPPAGGFPGPDNTGVPKGTTLTAYTGPKTITQDGTVIDGKTVDGSLIIRAANVTVRNSVINGTISTDENSSGYSFTIADSEVRVGDREGTGIGAVNFTVLRVEVTGGNRSMNCWKNCDIRASYVHGQFKDETGVAHESGIRMGAGGKIIGNTIICDAPDVPPDAGCSASLTGYGDFAAVQNMEIRGNLIGATTGGFCAYGGSSGGKPYSDGAHDIRFIDNIFERGPGGKCGYWGAITDFDSSAPGNVWQNNRWDDGSTVPPDN